MATLEQRIKTLEQLHPLRKVTQFDRLDIYTDEELYAYLGFTGEPTDEQLMEIINGNS